MGDEGELDEPASPPPRIILTNKGENDVRMGSICRLRLSKMRSPPTMRSTFVRVYETSSTAAAAAARVPTAERTAQLRKRISHAVDRPLSTPAQSERPPPPPPFLWQLCCTNHCSSLHSIAIADAPARSVRCMQLSLSFPTRRTERERKRERQRHTGGGTNEVGESGRLRCQVAPRSYLLRVINGGGVWLALE